MALLVEFAVVRQVALGRDAEDEAAVDDHGAVVQAAVVPERGAHDEHRLEVAPCLGDGSARVHALAQRLLQEQVLERVALRPSSVKTATSTPSPLHRWP